MGRGRDGCIQRAINTRVTVAHGDGMTSNIMYIFPYSLGKFFSIFE